MAFYDLDAIIIAQVAFTLSLLVGPLIAVFIFLRLTRGLGLRLRFWRSWHSGERRGFSSVLHLLALIVVAALALVIGFCISVIALTVVILPFF